eukprot:1154152-Pelagomonas_calceolata.AAC.2
MSVSPKTVFPGDGILNNASATPHLLLPILLLNKHTFLFLCAHSSYSPREAPHVRPLFGFACLPCVCVWVPVPGDTASAHEGGKANTALPCALELSCPDMRLLLVPSSRLLHTQMFWTCAAALTDGEGWCWCLNFRRLRSGVAIAVAAAAAAVC